MNELAQKGKSVFSLIAGFHIFFIALNLLSKGLSVSIGSIITLFILWGIYKGKRGYIDLYIGRVVLTYIIAGIALLGLMGVSSGFAAPYLVLLAISLLVEIIIIRTLKSSDALREYMKYQHEQLRTH